MFHDRNIQGFDIDVVAILGLDNDRGSLGCDDTGCLVELGQALGASHLLQLSLGLIGDKYVINSKFILVEKATVPYRNVRYVDATEQALLKGVRAVVADLALAQGWNLNSKSQETASETQAQDLDLAFWLGAGVAAAGLVTAAGLSYGCFMANEQVSATGEAALPVEKQKEVAKAGLLMGAGAVLSALVATGGVATLVYGSLANNKIHEGGE